MSLSSYNAPSNAVSAGMAWAPPQQNNHSHQHSAGDSCGSGIPAGLVGPSTGTSNTRGELTGDLCLTIDLFSNSNILSASWSEERNQCNLINDKTQAIVNLSSNGRELLSKDNLSLTTLDGADFVIGRKSASESALETFYPLSDLINFNTVRNKETKPSIEALIAPMLLLTEQSASSKARPVAAEESSKPKKGKKVKKSKKTISLVVPCGLDQNQTAKLILASTIADYQVKSFFNRGVAAVTGALYRSPRELSSFSMNKQDLFLILDNYISKNAASDPVVFYFNVYSLPPTNAVLYYDAALVRCEGGADAKAVGNLLGFERLSTLATAGGLVSSRFTENMFDINDVEHCAVLLSVVFEELVTDSKVDQSHVCVVMTEGVLTNSATLAASASPNTNKAHATGSTNHTSADATRIAAALTASLGVSSGKAATTGEMLVIKALAQDAVLGGCLLTAAELDSSKQYIQIEDVWKIAYQLPVADGILQSVDLGMRVSWSEADEAANQSKEPEVLFRKGDRLWKADIGPIKTSSNVVGSEVKREFKWGSLYFSRAKNPHGHVPKKGYPRVQLLQRVVASKAAATAGGANGEWVEIKTLTPLVAKDAENTYLDSKEPVESCNLQIAVNPSTGILEYTEVQGRSVSEVRSQHWGWFALALTLLAPFILYALYKLYGIAHERYVTYRHVAWIRDFYLKNAPDKLKDATYAERTALKYRDKMFLLWRQLEKTYKVKWQPPFSVIEEL